MKLFIFLFGITFLLIAATGLIVNWAKRRQRNTSHGLTGMCHENGDHMCASCASTIKLGKKSCSPREFGNPGSHP